MAIDPVCEMKVNEATALKAIYQGKTYYFCSPVCKAIFERDPEKYLLEKADKHLNTDPSSR